MEVLQDGDARIGQRRDSRYNGEVIAGENVAAGDTLVAMIPDARVPTVRALLGALAAGGVWYSVATLTKLR